MSSTEEDNALLCHSREVGLKESEAEVESVVESVIRGEERVRGCDDRDDSDEASVTGSRDETGEAVARHSDREGRTRIWRKRCY